MLNYFQCININVLVNKDYFRIYGGGTSLGIQWLKIHLAMQETWVQFLVSQGTNISHAGEQLTPTQQHLKPMSSRT